MYTDTVSGAEIEKSYNYASITKKKLRNVARADAVAIESNETSDVDIPLGTTIDVTPDPVIPPDPPTQAEIDKAAWFADWRRLNRLLELTTGVPALATTQATTLIANLQASLETDWDNSYLDNI